MKKTMIWKNLLLALTLMAMVGVSSPARAEWHFGIGTGLALMNVDGTMGFQVLKVNTPVEFDFKLDPQDFNDFTKSAFGFGGYATDGKWMIQYSYSNIELQDDATTVLHGGRTSINADLEFTMTGAEVIVGYPVYRADFLLLRAYTGARYTKHDLSLDVTTTSTVVGNDRKKRDIENDWVDALIGVLVDVPLAEKWMWNTRFDYGFGGSEGTYFVYTGVGWRFHKHWSATLYGRYASVDFENDSKGDADWYLYDSDESAVGLNILFNW